MLQQMMTMTMFIAAGARREVAQQDACLVLLETTATIQAGM